MQDPHGVGPRTELSATTAGLGQVKGWTHEIDLWVPVTLLPSHPKACPIFDDQAGVSPGVVDIHIQQHCVSLGPGTKGGGYKFY